jgi:hypothetical protein
VLKALIVGVTALTVTTSVALAAPQTKPPKTGLGCKPQVTVVLKGTIPTAPGSGAALPFALAITATHSNRFGPVYVKATQPVAVQVTDKTKIRRDSAKGVAALRAMLAGDRVLVTARACKPDLANNVTPMLTAVRLVAHPA